MMIKTNIAQLVESQGGKQNSNGLPIKKSLEVLIKFQPENIEWKMCKQK